MAARIENPAAIQIAVVMDELCHDCDDAHVTREERPRGAGDRLSRRPSDGRLLASPANHRKSEACRWASGSNARNRARTLSKSGRTIGCQPTQSSQVNCKRGVTKRID